MSIYPDTVCILTAATKTDPYTEETSRDWSQPPAVVSAPVAANVQPISSDEAVVTAETVVEKWRCFLPPQTPLTEDQRVRWHGHDFEVDGTVVRRYAGNREVRTQCLLKLARG